MPQQVAHITHPPHHRVKASRGGWAIGIAGGVLVNLNISQDGFNVKLVQNFNSDKNSYPAEVTDIVVKIRGALPT